MLYAQAFKKYYWVAVLITLLAYGVWRVLTITPFEQTVIHKLAINPLATLYVTEASAGATTSFSYRYFVCDARQSEAACVKSIKEKQRPFLVTDDPDATIEKQQRCLKITIRGRVYDYHAPAAYSTQSGTLSVPLCLASAPY